MRTVFLFLVLVSCTTTNHTWVLPTVETSPEERRVLLAVPVVPVEIQDLRLIIFKLPMEVEILFLAIMQMMK